MICVSVANITFQELKEVLSDFEMLELRLDLLDFSDDEYQYIIDTKKPVIATYRYGTADDKTRILALQKLIEMGATHVDIEIDAEPDFVNTMMNFAKEHQCKTLLSYHNFEATPELEKLTDIIENSKQLGANYTKIATMANSEEDAKKVLSLYDNHKHLIAFAMGKHGMASRLSSLFLGADFTYAALSKEKATADGQLDYKTLKELLALIK